MWGEGLVTCSTLVISTRIFQGPASSVASLVDEQMDGWMDDNYSLHRKLRIIHHQTCAWDVTLNCLIIVGDEWFDSIRFSSFLHPKRCQLLSQYWLLSRSVVMQVQVHTGTCFTLVTNDRDRRFLITLIGYNFSGSAASFYTRSSILRVTMLEYGWENDKNMTVEMRNYQRSNRITNRVWTTYPRA